MATLPRACASKTEGMQMLNNDTDLVHRDPSIHKERPPPPSQVVHAPDNWVEANIGRLAKS